MNICYSCWSILDTTNTIPKNSIVNGFYIVPIPVEFISLTPLEVALCSLAHGSHLIKTVTGFNSVMQSHSCLVAADPVAVEILPNDVLEQEIFKVTVVGSLTSTNEALLKKTYNVNGQNVVKFYKFLCEHNNLYKSGEVEFSIHRLEEIIKKIEKKSIFEKRKASDEDEVVIENYNNEGNVSFNREFSGHKFFFNFFFLDCILHC